MRMGPIQNGPDSPRSRRLYAASVAAIEQDRLEDAVETLRLLLEAAPGHSDAWNNLGVVMEALGNPGEALRCYRSALEADAGHAEARSNHTSLALNLALAAETRRQAFNSMFMP
jgi:Flp pilus assembly protein TadD